jgi:hypothetical protein
MGNLLNPDEKFSMGGSYDVINMLSKLGNGI